MTYLHATRNLPDHWYPKDLQKRAVVDQWMHWHHTAIRPGALLFFETVVKPMIGLEPNLNYVETCKATFTRGLKCLEPVLAKNEYLCGPEISVADLNSVMDIYHLTIVNFDYGKFPNVTRWMDQIISMPEVLESHAFFEKMKAKAMGTSKL